MVDNLSILRHLNALPRMRFNRRNSFVQLLRQQKAEVLASHRCFACQRDLVQREPTALFLRRMDSKAVKMEAYMHVHK